MKAYVSAQVVNHEAISFETAISSSLRCTCNTCKKTGTHCGAPNFGCVPKWHSKSVAPGRPADGGNNVHEGLLEVSTFSLVQHP